MNLLKFFKDRISFGNFPNKNFCCFIACVFCSDPITTFPPIIQKFIIQIKIVPLQKFLKKCHFRKIQSEFSKIKREYKVNMSREEVVKTVNSFLVEEIEIEEHLLKEEAVLKDDLGIDSLDFVDIVVIVERHFGFKIKPEEMSNVRTLAQFYDYIESKVNER
jgi:acyl carrier protein